MFSFIERGSIKPIAEIVNDKGKGSGKFLYLHRKVDNGIFPKGFFDEITLNEGEKFSWIPDIRESFNDAICISAPKGSGKSTLASNIAMKIKKVFDLTDDDVIVCKKSNIEDPAFASLNPQYVYINDDFLENPLTCDEISPDKSPKVVILDDLDTINSKALKDCAIKFTNSLLEEGRKYNIYIIIANHHMASGLSTKAILSESDYLTFFPESVTSDFRYALQKYCDMPISVIRDLKKIGSKWVMFQQRSPRFILSEKRAVIYDLDREQKRIKEEEMIQKESNKNRAILSSRLKSGNGLKGNKLTSKFSKSIKDLRIISDEDEDSMISSDEYE